MYASTKSVPSCRETGGKFWHSSHSSPATISTRTTERSPLEFEYLFVCKHLLFGAGLCGPSDTIPKNRVDAKIFHSIVFHVLSAKRSPVRAPQQSNKNVRLGRSPRIPFLYNARSGCSERIFTVRRFRHLRARRKKPSNSRFFRADPLCRYRPGARGPRGRAYRFPRFRRALAAARLRNVQERL